MIVKHLNPFNIPNTLGESQVLTAFLKTNRLEAHHKTREKSFQKTGTTIEKACFLNPIRKQYLKRQPRICFPYVIIWAGQKFLGISSPTRNPVLSSRALKVINSTLNPIQKQNFLQIQIQKTSRFCTKSQSAVSPHPESKMKTLPFPGMGIQKSQLIILARVEPRSILPCSDSFLAQHYLDARDRDLQLNIVDILRIHI